MAPAQHLEEKYLNGVQLLLVNESEAGILVNRPVTGIEEAKAAAEAPAEEAPAEEAKEETPAEATAEGDEDKKE